MDTIQITQLAGSLTALIDGFTESRMTMLKTTNKQQQAIEQLMNTCSTQSKTIDELWNVINKQSETLNKQNETILKQQIGLENLGISLLELQSGLQALESKQVKDLGYLRERLEALLNAFNVPSRTDS